MANRAGERLTARNRALPAATVPDCVGHQWALALLPALCARSPSGSVLICALLLSSSSSCSSPPGDRSRSHSTAKFPTRGLLLLPPAAATAGCHCVAEPQPCHLASTEALSAAGAVLQMAPTWSRLGVPDSLCRRAVQVRVDGAGEAGASRGCGVPD